VSLMETDPVRSHLVVQTQSLIGLKSGLDIAVAKIDRLVTREATLPEIGNAVLDAVAALGFCAVKLNGLANTLTSACAATPKGTECLTDYVDALQAKIDADMAENPPPPVSAKVLQFTRQRIEHGPVPPEPPCAA
jgi:hypothetical protein